MKAFLIFASLLLAWSQAQSQSCDMYFSEYLEGASNNKAIEIFNNTGDTVDLTNYKIYRYNNGSPSPTDSLFPQGFLAPDSVYIAGNPSAIASILAVSDTLHTITFFNGDDAMSLVKISSNTVLDVIGEIGTDPGINWVVGAGATSEFTLVRNFAVTAGTTSWATGATQWDVYPQNTVTYLNYHDADICCSTVEIPINLSGCDSVVSVSGTEVYYTSGLYSDTISSVGSCDTIYQITASIGYSSVSSINPVACFGYFSPDSLEFWTVSGIYYDTLTNATGCDSIIEINLTIHTVDVTVNNSDPMLSAFTAGASYQWLDCANMMSEISGETAQSFTATSNGSFAVEITQNGCTDTSDCFPIITLDIESAHFPSTVLLYPNPATDHFILSFGSSVQNVEVAICDLSGRVLYRESAQDLRFLTAKPHIEPGMYYVVVITSDFPQQIIPLTFE